MEDVHARAQVPRRGTLPDLLESGHRAGEEEGREREVTRVAELALLVALVGSGCVSRELRAPQGVAQSTARPAEDAPSYLPNQSRDARSIDADHEAAKLAAFRSKLASDDPQAVAWGAWSIAEGRLDAATDDLRAIAPKWKRNEVVAARVLDALIRVGARLDAAELDAWVDAREVRGALLVLATRARSTPSKLLLRVFRDASDGGTNEPLDVVAGAMLVSSGSPEAAMGLVEFAKIPVHVEVIDPGSAPTPRGGGVGAGLMLGSKERGYPPRPSYAWSRERTHDGVPFDRGGERLYWTRVVREGRPRECVPTGYWDGHRAEKALALVRAMVLDDLDEADRAEPRTIVHEFTSVEELSTFVDRWIRSARERWSRLADALRRRGLVTEAFLAQLGDRIDLEVHDDRAEMDPPLPVLRP